MAPFEKHIFICCNQREAGHPRGSCDPDADDWLQKAFKKALAERGLEQTRAGQQIGLSGSVRDTARPSSSIPIRSGTARVTEADIDEIIDRHIVSGQPVERLRLPDACVNTATCAHKPRSRQVARWNRELQRPAPATLAHCAPWHPRNLWTLWNLMNLRPMFDAFLTTDGLIALVTLTFLEIVLGVDNVIFISILSGKLRAGGQATRTPVGA